MFIILIRTILLFAMVMFSLRIMGKRQIGQLQPYELVVAIMVSELASLPMQDTRIPLIHGIIPIVTLLVIEVMISFLEIKSQKFRILIDGKPSIIICKGKLVKEEMKNQLFTVNDLLEEMRIKGYFSIQDIEYGILETNGELSIVPKSPAEPPVKRDLNIKPSQKTFPAVLILEGKINYENLTLINRDVKWLKSQLAKEKIKEVSEVFVAILDSDNNIFIQKYNERKYNVGEIDI
ncbi:DUF421 domain-containing protein [Clostridium sp. 19966]|uniref:DUF421 domain-containing protein n=1 Tax=Clostridium sp. 19966 TaxID=2768166 RepID=UPI0028DDE819|nr:DUF421 domain-containing protein [Clostridium sp. 19966]MDT8718526.1 DUF421 domain-containing protein [Clostridium sp. 19966]